MADELKMWALGERNEVEAVESVSGVKLEDILEETLVRRPEMLEAGLHLVGRQTPTEGGPSDLLGVDAGGRLVVFELKRGTLKREAVTQCIDYTSALDGMTLEDLAGHITVQSGSAGIEEIADFEDWYQEQFADGDLSDLLPPRMVLVGLGVDDRAERMAHFLSRGGINISVLTFYGFVRGGETLLARQVEVKRNASPASHQRNASLAERRLTLQTHLSTCEPTLKELFDEVCETVRTALPSGVYESPQGHGISFQLQIVGPSGIRGPRTYFSVLAGYAEPDSVTISLGGAALRENASALATLEGEIALRDWSHGNVGRAVFISSDEQWEQQRDAVVRFVEATAKAWHGYRNVPQEAS